MRWSQPPTQEGITSGGSRGAHLLLHTLQLTHSWKWAVSNPCTVSSVEDHAYFWMRENYCTFIVKFQLKKPNPHNPKSSCTCQTKTQSSSAECSPLKSHPSPQAHTAYQKKAALTKHHSEARPAELSMIGKTRISGQFYSLDSCACTKITRVFPGQYVHSLGTQSAIYSARKPMAGPLGKKK